MMNQKCSFETLNWLEATLNQKEKLNQSELELKKNIRYLLTKHNLVCSLINNYFNVGFYSKKINAKNIKKNNSQTKLSDFEIIQTSLINY